MMICPCCRMSLPELARFCPNCGTPVAAPAPVPQPVSQAQYSAPVPPPTTCLAASPYSVPTCGTNGKGFAVTGLVLGILTILNSFVPFLGLIFGIPSLIFAIIAMCRTRKGVSGRGIAVAGLTCSIVGISLTTMIGVCTVLLAILRDSIVYGAPSAF